MIAIVDGGSTKCDWVLLREAGTEKLRTVTNGFNPNMVAASTITTELDTHAEISGQRFAIRHLFFYGSGCGTEKNCSTVKSEFAAYFPNASIVVEDDMLAAAYAAYNGRPAIVCILGTGSNACYFDGENLRRDLPSLGFLIGDEGSGSAIGKLLLRRYFMKKLPADLHEDFVAQYGLTIEDALDKMYHNPRANAFLGGFNRFVAERKKHPYFQNMLFDEMKNFLDYQVLPYPEAKEAEINFIGYVAYIYEDILRAAAAELNLTIGTIVQKPIDSLVAYHKKYILGL